MAARMPEALLTPPVIARPGEVVDICAGPGGWDVGGRILGLPDMVGLDVDEDACATARANGFRRIRGDMRRVAPKRHRGLAGCVISPPCPAWSPAGLRAGRRDMQIVLDAFTCMGIDCGCNWPDLIHTVEDPRAALALEVARWGLLAPRLPFLVAELTDGGGPLWQDMVAELYAAEWEWADVVEIDAQDYGVPSSRPRVFLVAQHYTVPTVDFAPSTPIPTLSAATALGWEPGTKVITRGSRRPTGGNAFSADKPSWCITGKTRSWEIGHVGGPKFTEAEAGHLVGFPLNYRWVGNSRTSRFQRIGDVVSPVVAAVVLGVATNTPWEGPVAEYLRRLYGESRELAAARTDVRQAFGPVAQPAGLRPAELALF